jgi:hypothetical protein
MAVKLENGKKAVGKAVSASQAVERHKLGPEMECKTLREILVGDKDEPNKPLIEIIGKARLIKELSKLVKQKVIFVYQRNAGSLGMYRGGTLSKIEPNLIWFERGCALGPEYVNDLCLWSSAPKIGDGKLRVYHFAAHAGEESEYIDVIDINPFSAYIAAMEKVISGEQHLGSINVAKPGMAFYRHENTY